MRLVKQLGSTIVGGGLQLCGGLIFLTAISGTALAFDGVTPEMDPGSIMSAVTLLMGSVMLLTGRRWKM